MKGWFTHWSFDLSSAALLLLVVGFLAIAKAFSNKKAVTVSFLLLIICFFSPLHLLSSYYLFSVHMIVHVTLLLCVGPLLVPGLSREQKRFHLLSSFLKRHPMASWLVGVGMMWFWHIPAVFNSSMSSLHHQNFHIVFIAESLSLIFAGVLFSAPVIHPDKKYRIDALSGVVYLFTACIGCSLLGLLITFAPAGTYRHFLSMHDEFGWNKIILQMGITQSSDQQAAGLIMWVPCCLIYLTGALYLLVHWFKQKEDKTTLIEQI